MHLSSRVRLVLTLWSVELCNPVFPILLGCVLLYCDWSLKILTRMAEFGCRFFDLGSQSNQGSLIMLFFLASFGVGLRVSQFGGFKWFAHEFVRKSRILSDGLFSNRVYNDGFLAKSKALKDSISTCKANGDFEEEEEAGWEDEVLSVTALRKMVKDEKRKVNEALKDLDKERMAAASAAEEAMAMIFRLQKEKSLLQMGAKRLQRWAEEKQSYDEEVIQSLEWSLMQCEEEKNRMEEDLRLCKNRLKLYEQDDGSGTIDIPSCKIHDLKTA